MLVAQVAKSQTRHVRLVLERAVDMAGLGYYSGDTHIHLDRKDEDDDQRALDLMAAEDIQYGTLLCMNDPSTYSGLMDRQEWPQHNGFGPDSTGCGESQQCGQLVLDRAESDMEFELLDLRQLHMEREGAIMTDADHADPATMPDGAGGEIPRLDVIVLGDDRPGAFAARFPWVRYYTPVNEIYVCAKLSALQGLWNERRKDDRAFVTATTVFADGGLSAI